jgi:alkylation response protein AidB-like acyl-CoA dehydrogenase
LKGHDFSRVDKTIKINWASAPEGMRRKKPDRANESNHRGRIYGSTIMSVVLESVESLYPFVLTEEQELLRREIREFAAREIAPNVMAWDEAGQFPLATVKKLGAMGLLGIIFPPEYGGAGLGYVDYTLAIEELSAVDGSLGLTVAAHNSLGANHIFLAGSELQKRKYIPLLASGEWLAAWALTEPGSGSDAAGAKTTAVKKGDRYVLNGNKTFITNGSYADVAVVIAITDRSKGTHGLSAFVVEKGTPGFRPGKKENKLGLRASDTSELVFEDCEIPAENLLGVEGEGFIDAMRVLDGGRISIAALSLGIGRGALDAALKYVKERRQFGKAIAEFQGIQWKLADMATELDAARLLTQRAAVLKDAGRKVTRESAMAKLFASEVAVKICNEAVQLFGGYGFIKDYPAEKYYRDVKLCTIGEGTSEIQRMVIAREILKVHPSRG